MNNVAIKAQSLPVSGVKDEHQQFFDFSLMVRLVSGAATPLTTAVGVVQHLFGPCFPTVIGANNGRKVVKIVSLPVWMVITAKVLTHPLTMADGRAKVILRSLVARGSEHFLATPCAGDNADPVATGYSHSALDRAVDLNTPTFTTKAFKGSLAFRAGSLFNDFRHSNAS